MANYTDSEILKRNTKIMSRKVVRRLAYHINALYENRERYPNMNERDLLRRALSLTSAELREREI